MLLLKRIPLILVLFEQKENILCLKKDSFDLKEYKECFRIPSIYNKIKYYNYIYYINNTFEKKIEN